MNRERVMPAVMVARRWAGVAELDVAEHEHAVEAVLPGDDLFQATGGYHADAVTQMRLAENRGS